MLRGVCLPYIWQIHAPVRSYLAYIWQFGWLKPPNRTLEVLFRRERLPCISEIGVLKLCGVSVSAESDTHGLVLGVWMSDSGESDSWAAVFGFCLSVSAESDNYGVVFGLNMSVSAESDIQSTLSGWRLRRSW